MADNDLPQPLKPKMQPAKPPKESPAYNGNGNGTAEVAAPPKKGKKHKETTKYIFELVEKVTPNNTDLAPPPYGIRNPCHTFDETSGRQRTLRLLKGINEIWMDEQESKVTPEFVRRNIVELKITGGFLFLDHPVQKAAIDFMLNHDDIESKEMRIGTKPTRFRLVNNEVLEKTEGEFLDKQEQAMKYAKEASDEQMLYHARHLNINFMDKFGAEKDTGIIRNDYRRLAVNNPALFLKDYDNPKLKIKFLIQKAMEDGLIDIHHVRGEARWGSTKSLIIRYDMRKDAVDELVNYAFTDEGKDFLMRVTPV